MYSKEKRIKAIDLWLKYDKCTAAVIQELEYPGYKTLTRWCKDYQLGVLLERKERTPKFTKEQQRAAVDYYLEHGRCLARTIRALGYPNRGTLQKWRDELAPEQRKSRVSVVQFSQEQKKDAVIALCSRRGSAQAVAEASGATRAALYKWKNDLLGKEIVMAKSKKRNQDLPDNKDQLISEIESLKEQVRRLNLEKDILEAAAELIKKDPGVDLADLSNREKVMLIDALKNDHPLKDLMKSLCMPRSSYYYQQ